MPNGIKLNETLRNDFIEYAFGDLSSWDDTASRRAARKPWTVAQTRATKDAILKGLQQIGMHPRAEVVSGYFDKLEKITAALEKEGFNPKKPNSRYYEWILNMPQVKRIENLIQRMELYNAERDKLLKRVEEFTSSVNSFLMDTGKTIAFDPSGEIIASLGSGRTIQPESLSSGEAQLLILFSYLYFGFQPKEKFIVMIDEPELSLHLKWQHQYVDSVVKANPVRSSFSLLTPQKLDKAMMTAA